MSLTNSVDFRILSAEYISSTGCVKGLKFLIPIALFGKPKSFLKILSCWSQIWQA